MAFLVAAFIACWTPIWAFLTTLDVAMATGVRERAVVFETFFLKK